MTKGQRKFRIALFGAIAAVAIAVGLALYGALPWAALFGLIAANAGGWAVHVTLSGQNSSITATNGGVVNKDTQGSPVTNTGSGDITHSIQHKGTLKNPVFRRVLRVVDELLAGLYRHGSKMRVILYDSLCSVAVRPVFRRFKR